MQIGPGMHPRFAIDEGAMVHLVYTRDGHLYYRKVTAPPRSAAAKPASRGNGAELCGRAPATLHRSGPGMGIFTGNSWKSESELDP
jgi:hypothetical protein